MYVSTPTNRMYHLKSADSPSVSNMTSQMHDQHSEIPANANNICFRCIFFCNDIFCCREDLYKSPSQYTELLYNSFLYMPLTISFRISCLFLTHISEYIHSQSAYSVHGLFYLYSMTSFPKSLDWYTEHATAYIQAIPAALKSAV